MSLKACVVGVGHLGRFHAQKYKKVKGASLIGVFDMREARASEVASELEVPVLRTLDECVEKCDIATVACSTMAHFEVAKKFLEAGKSVLIEKPITSRSGEARELVQLAEKTGAKLQVGHVERFNPALISAGEMISRPLFIEVHRLAPFTPRGADVDVVLDLMIHDLDVILSLVKSNVKSISAVGVPVLTKLIDIANARIEFDSGTIVNVTASRVSMQTTRKFRVFETDKYLSIDFGKGNVDLMTKKGEWSATTSPIHHETWSLEKGDALLAETQSFVDCVTNNTKPYVSGTDGLAALTIAEQVQKDIRERLQKIT